MNTISPLQLRVSLVSLIPLLLKDRHVLFMRVFVLLPGLKITLIVSLYLCIGFEFDLDL